MQIHLEPTTRLTQSLAFVRIELPIAEQTESGTEDAGALARLVMNA
jgi:hypothetical protein